MPPVDRRGFLQALAALGLATGLPARAERQDAPRFAADPFSLGIASGYPRADAIMLWTRLAPVPQHPDGGMDPVIVPVRWEVANDEGMRRIVASGSVDASPDWAHAVHAQVTGLSPQRWYWYRFTAGNAQSPIGRTRTAPAADARPAALRFAFASCQQYEQGYFNAYRHMVRDELDLVVFLGDYIYESSWGRDHVRRQPGGEPLDLPEYRTRYALYKGDRDLQAAHAAFPWIATWDDHEVENDYAGAHSENRDSAAWFLARRAAAYKAFYEHMPLPPAMRPQGPHAKIYTRVGYGDLAGFHVLDDRQYRAPQVCPKPLRGGSNTVDVAECPDLQDPARSLLGIEQERWLESGLSGSTTKWNILAQQTRMAQFDQKPGPGRHAWTDGWDGYPVARKKLVDFVAEHRIANPVVIGGDVHMFFVNDIKRDFDNPDSPTVASEFVGTSITSQAFAQSTVNRYLPDNPHMILADSRYRGYARVEVTPKRLTTDLRAMDSVKTPEAACRTLASFVVEDGRPGPQKA